MKNVAIIPARGGSKRIPLKNIKDFCGKPIISYSIKAAIKSKLFCHVIVSTDSGEIAEVARKYGAETPFVRPRSIADDFTGTNEVIKHALLWLQNNGVEVDFACCIYPTAPFLRLEYLKKGLKQLTETEKLFAFSVTTFPFPIQRAIRISRDGFVDPIYPEKINKRSQDLEEAFHDAGQFYWGTVNAFLNDRDLYSNNSVTVKIPRYLVQDIDTLEDWERAEYMFKALHYSKSESD